MSNEEKPKHFELYGLGYDKRQLGNIGPWYRDPFVHSITEDERLNRELEAETLIFYAPEPILVRNPSRAGGKTAEASASAMKMLGETCRRLFLNVRFPSQIMWEIADELLTLDYAPVMRYFLPRGIYQVIYEPQHNAFIFTFKALANELGFRKTRDALIFMRFHRMWSTPITVPLDPAKLLTDLEGKQIMRSDFSTDALVEIERRGFSGSAKLISAPLRNLPCRSCGMQNGHLEPPFNRLENCTFCGLSFSSSVASSSGAGISPSIPQTPQPFPPSHTAYVKAGPVAKCPSCWSEFEITEEIRDRASRTTGKTLSGCANGCKVDARQLWERILKVIPTGCLP